jgi:hypothetical protein
MQLCFSFLFASGQRERSAFQVSENEGGGVGEEEENNNNNNNNWVDRLCGLAV